MQMEKLPLPNPEDWITIDGTAELLDVSRRTVTRLIGANTLTLHRPRHRKGERVQGWLWYPQVIAYARALSVVRGAERAPEAR